MKISDSKLANLWHTQQESSLPTKYLVPAIQYDMADAELQSGTYLLSVAVIYKFYAQILITIIFFCH